MAAQQYNNIHSGYKHITPLQHKHGAHQDCVLLDQDQDSGCDDVLC